MICVKIYRIAPISPNTCFSRTRRW